MSATRFTSVRIEDHDFLHPGHGPLPMDPVDVEALPPADLDDCEHCDGLGARVVYIEAETGLPVDEPCTWCDGTGDRRSAVA
jgi:hypothetical protein